MVLTSLEDNVKGKLSQDGSPLIRNLSLEWNRAVGYRNPLRTDSHNSETRYPELIKASSVDICTSSKHFEPLD